MDFGDVFLSSMTMRRRSSTTGSSIVCCCFSRWDGDGVVWRELSVREYEEFGKAKAFAVTLLITKERLP